MKDITQKVRRKFCASGFFIYLCTNYQVVLGYGDEFIIGTGRAAAAAGHCRLRAYEQAELLLC